ncbi:MAG: hypothetical protein KF883_00095 [Thermomicrobiales bacterium]|jgi:hypothetical protein|nr:hypothetical protein [Thermomicrobiales bacterium]MCC6944641.1 hypothetical protein [Thermomicrobiales bacterium]
MECAEQTGARTEVELGPGTVYEVVTRNMVNSLSDDVREIRNRINGLFWLLAGTVAVDLVMKALSL